MLPDNFCRLLASCSEPLESDMGYIYKVLDKRNIVFYDGECRFCSAVVNFIIDHNSKRNIFFASLQSELGQHTLSELGMPLDSLSTIICKIEGQTFKKSTAVLEIARHLDGSWRHLSKLLIIPRFIRDFGYDVVAKLRFTLAGRTDHCRVPSPEDRERYLDFPLSEAGA